ncbi:type II toxin-antitoxin system RelE/ParE family toxin [Lonepinella sp. BR2271]|uniref:type II toxin-antitoxin system RelE/ParE family toxin n=1 Tax=Lonepinella sp. BR2271 TaxID=3434550 RepID=UPI003F6E154B
MAKMKAWKVILQKEVKLWLTELDPDDTDNVFSAIRLLKMRGPNLGRPYVDTLHSVKYPNMKELRVQSKQSVFRLFFIFDPLRQAVVLCGGDKKGKNEKRFYTTMITQAEKIYEIYLTQMENK